MGSVVRVSVRAAVNVVAMCVLRSATAVPGFARVSTWSSNAFALTSLIIGTGIINNVGL